METRYEIHATGQTALVNRTEIQRRLAQNIEAAKTRCDRLRRLFNTATDIANGWQPGSADWVREIGNEYREAIEALDNSYREQIEFVIHGVIPERWFRPGGKLPSP